MYFNFSQIPKIFCSKHSIYLNTKYLKLERYESVQYNLLDLYLMLVL